MAGIPAGEARQLLLGLLHAMSEVERAALWLWELRGSGLWGVAGCQGESQSRVSTPASEAQVRLSCLCCPTVMLQEVIQSKLAARLASSSRGSSRWRRSCGPAFQLKQLVFLPHEAAEGYHS
jgi:hypothetical protein